MLSIGKVGGGAANPSYYLETVASGAEDYYAGRGEARGRWRDGRAVEPEAFRSVLEAPAAQGRSVLAFDLTFSAPKSVSILFGVADEAVAAEVRAGHDEAVRQALGYLEREACWTRRGAGGAQLLRGEGFEAALFRHRTTRAGDPQLHTHAVIVNATTAEGRSTALDGRALFAHARTAGFLYECALRHELTERLGLAWTPAVNGIADVDGVPSAAIEHFSKRRAEIQERMAEMGGRSARSAQIATLETRRTKTHDVELADLRAGWRARAAAHGLDTQTLHAVLQPATPRDPDLQRIAEHLSGPVGLTRGSSTFDRRDVLRAWAEAHPGAPVAQIEQRADGWLASERALRLEPLGDRAQRGGPRHSTPELLRLERELLDGASGRRAAGIAVAPGTATPGLSEEQQRVVDELTGSGDGVQVVRAAAGTGKTHALSAARAAWAADGIYVFGAALSARAALEVEQLAGIDATTIARLKRDINDGHGLPRGSVLVVDEAGMVGTRDLHHLAEHCTRTASKLVLVGDDRQLPEIDAGGAFRALAERLGSSSLREVRRQEQAWDRLALAELRSGDVEQWASSYSAHGRVRCARTSWELRERMADDWWQATKAGADAVLIAHRRADVADLNQRARQRMRDNNRLHGDDLAGFAVGDRVLARHNDRTRGLINGQRADVIATDDERRSLTIITADGTRCEVTEAYLEAGHLHHGYAVTAHIAQGATVDRTFVLGSDELYREWGYTALSRHRQDAHLYLVATGCAERASVEDTAALLHSSHAQVGATTVDRVGAADAARQRAERLAAERQAVRPWQSTQRRVLDRQIAAQLAEAKYWDTARPEPVPARAIGADPMPVAALVAPAELAREVGSRPERLSDREHWLRRVRHTLAGAARTDRATTDGELTRPGRSDDDGLDLGW